MKALEHPLGMARLALAKPDVLHVQWFGAPELDRWLFRPRSPVVFTAHDIVPRRTKSKTGLWRALFGRCDRVVVHSERGRGQLVEFGVAEEKLRVIPHPAFRSEIDRRDDGRTALLHGLIRPVQGRRGRGRRGAARRRRAARRRGRSARAARRTSSGAPATGRSGGSASCPREEVRRALSDATVSLFPYREEIDLSGALLQSLGAGLPAIVYDIGGLGELVGRYGAGAVVEPGDVEGMAAALERLLSDPDALAAARRGAERAREELTWEASAQAHLAVYRELA